MRLTAFAGLLGALLLAAQPALADITARNAYASIVVGPRGQVLSADSADEQRFPASLTKMMTLYMLFEAIRDRRLSLDSRITMSAESASRPPSKLGLPAGMSLSVEQAILAVITRSANDVAAAIGEQLGGSEERFAQMMTQRARQLGMTRTTFRNASGLPDVEQLTTARDMALLGTRLQQDFPQHYRYFGTTHFRWQNRAIHNHNHMLSAYSGADGIKTGYTRWSGFNIVTSAERDGVRLVGVVLGGGSWVERDRHMATLLDEGFARLGVARRANSYDVAQTNRDAARMDMSANAAGSAGGRAPTRLVPGPRATPEQRRPAMAAVPAPRQRRATDAATQRPPANQAPRSVSASPASAPRSAGQASPQPRPRPVAQQSAPRAATTPAARATPAELRPRPLQTPSRPVVRT
jgi:D-alanyl-D-alanine carboxypeptidase